MTDAVIDEYDGTTCPACGAKHTVSGGAFQYGTDQFAGYGCMTCENCGATWEEVYQLKGYVNLVNPNKPSKQTKPPRAWIVVEGGNVNEVRYDGGGVGAVRRSLREAVFGGDLEVIVIDWDNAKARGPDGEAKAQALYDEAEKYPMVY